MSFNYKSLPTWLQETVLQKVVRMNEGEILHTFLVVVFHLSNQRKLQKQHENLLFPFSFSLFRTAPFFLRIFCVCCLKSDHCVVRYCHLCVVLLIMSSLIPINSQYCNIGLTFIKDQFCFKHCHFIIIKLISVWFTIHFFLSCVNLI